MGHYIDRLSIVAPKTISMDMSVVNIMAMMRSKTPCVFLIAVCMHMVISMAAIR